MKTKILFFMIFISLNVFGQAYTQLLSPTKYFDDYFWSNPSYCKSVRHVISGDTLINGLTFKKVYNFDFIKTPPYYLCKSGVVSDSSYFSGIYLREDTLLKKVYKYTADYEDLLYDFSLNVHDTLKSNDLTQSMGFVIVDSIDFVMISNGDMRKRFFLNTGANYIEGIGGSTGLYEPLMNYGIGFGSELLCVKENLVDLFGTVCNNFFVSNTTYKLINNYFSVNKLDNQLIIKCENDALLIIINSLGQEVFKTNISKESSFPTNELPNGILEILLYDKAKSNKIYRKKIINGI